MHCSEIWYGTIWRDATVLFYPTLRIHHKVYFQIFEVGITIFWQYDEITVEILSGIKFSNLDK